jgi:sugar fermentation stimulation protein A
MNFKNELKPATLIKRYKRFLADVILDDHTVITVYCPNTGSMRSCSTPGNRVYISRAENQNRKYPFTLEMIKEGQTWVGVNTSLTNRIVAEAIENGEVAEFIDIDSIRHEVKTSAKTRLDLLLRRGEQKIYVEIKNCSLVEDGVAMFPDAVTVRGTKHLRELAELVRQGHEGVIFYLVQRDDAVSFRPAAHVDPVYAEALAEVSKKGVQVLVYQAAVRPDSISVVQALPFTIT